MSQISFGEMLEKSASEDTRPVDVSESLRTTSWLSIASFLIGLLLYTFLPLPEKVIASRFYLVMDKWLAWMINLILENRLVFFLVIGCALGLAVALLVITLGFTHARLVFQWMVYGVSFLGAANALFMAGMATIVVINLLIWALAVCLVLTIVGLILYVVYIWFFEGIV